MDFLDKVKAKLQSAGPDKPIDITQAIRQAMDKGAIPLTRERTVAPNRFQVFLTPATDEAFTQWGKEALLSEFLRDAQLYAAEQNYSLVGSVQIELLVATENTRKTEVKAQSVAGTKAVSPKQPTPSQISATVPPTKPAAARDTTSNPQLAAPVSVSPGEDDSAPQPAVASPVPEWNPVKDEDESQLLLENQERPLLEIIDGQTYLLLGERSIIGRGDNVDIDLQDSSVSHRHMEIVQVGEHFVLRDLGSTNGTYVEGNKIKEATLLDRNIIQAGRIKMIFWRQSSDTEGTA